MPVASKGSAPGAPASEGTAAARASSDLAGVSRSTPGQERIQLTCKWSCWRARELCFSPGRRRRPARPPGVWLESLALLCLTWDLWLLLPPSSRARLARWPQTAVGWLGVLRSHFSPTCSCTSWPGGHRSRRVLAWRHSCSTSPPPLPCRLRDGLTWGWLLCAHVCWACSEAPGRGEGRWGLADLGLHSGGALPFPAR